MSGHVLPFEGRSHRDVERLLPWYANATLEPAERDLVHAHLSECAQCRSELAALLAQMDALEDDVQRESTLDHDWHRLRGRLHAQRQAAARSPWMRARSGWRNAAPWMRAALAAQLAIVAVLAAFLMRDATPVQPEAAYRTLSASNAVPVSNDDTLLVVFDPRLTDAQLRELLGANHARIIDGPNTAGAFLVAVPAGQAELVRNSLRASTGVAMVERLAPPAQEDR